MFRLMKIVFIFAIGILSFTFGEDGSSSTNRFSEEEFRSTLITGANYTHATAKGICDRANLSAVSQAVDNDYEQLVNCFTDNFNYTVVSRILEMNLTDYNDTRLLPKLFCDSILPFSKCLFNFKNIAKPCIPEFEASMVEFGQNMATTGLDFICRDNYANSDRFLTSDGISCINSSSYGFPTCARTMEEKYNLNPYSLSSSSQQQFLERICKSVPEMQTCVIEEMRKCNNQTPADIMNTLINVVKAVSPCANLVKAVPTNL